MDVVVARIGQAHGLRGEVTIEVRTDAPQAAVRARGPLPDRARPGRPAGAGERRGTTTAPCCSASPGVPDRTAAEGLRGVLLLVDTDEAVGRATTPGTTTSWSACASSPLDGEPVGEVVALEPPAHQDLLVVRLVDGREGLVPFVTAIVPEVDVAGGRVVIDPPAGLFDLDEP